MSMTRDAIERLRSKGEHFIYSLEANSDNMIRLQERGQFTASREMKTGISGYLHGLRDAGIISENERRVLYIYYATTRGTVQEA